MPGLVPGIHAATLHHPSGVCCIGSAWMAGTSPIGANMGCNRWARSFARLREKAPGSAGRMRVWRVAAQTPAFSWPRALGRNTGMPLHGTPSPERSSLAGHAILTRCTGASRVRVTYIREPT